MIVYLATMCGVYDQGSCGVFSTREAAQKHIDAHQADSDHYHDYRIDELTVDQPIWLEQRKRWLL